MENNNSRYKAARAATAVLLYFLLALVTLAVVVPFYLIFISSIKHNYELLSSTFTWWPKYGISFDGYKTVISADSEIAMFIGSSIPLSFWNTIWQSIIPTLAGIFVSGASGYAISKLKFPCRGAIFSFLIATMMIPGTITLVSSYLLFDTIGWTNGPLPLIIPGLFGSAGNVFFMRQYFTGLPDELTEAAKLDGLSNFGTFVRIAMPLSVPVFVSLSLLSFISHYNAYLNPLIYLGDNAKYYTLQIMLKSLMSLYKNQWDVILATCIVSIVPLLVLYLFTQKFFIKGISMSSGLKG